jgi:hypothetical protein
MIKAITTSAQAQAASVSGVTWSTDSNFAAMLKTETDKIQSGASTSVSPTAAAPSTVLAADPGIATVTPAQRQQFVSELTQALQAAGVDTSQSISLTTDANGHVVAKAGTAQASQIDAVFAKNPQLTNAYIKITDYDQAVAAVKVDQAYTKAVDEGGDANGTWGYLSGILASANAVAGQETLANGQLDSAALAVV